MTPAAQIFARTSTTITLTRALQKINPKPHRLLACGYLTPKLQSRLPAVTLTEPQLDETNTILNQHNSDLCTPKH